MFIKADSGGPVLYKARVVGCRGRCFWLYKFRTMRPDANDAKHREALAANVRNRQPTSADSSGRRIYKTALSDPSRITRVGRLLRKTSIDEVPQLWNVLRGDMSLVGPRPPLVYEAELYEDWQYERFQVPPGITGLYQVTARNRVPVDEMVRIDLEYVRHRSLALDFRILIKTPLVMLRGV